MEEKMNTNELQVFEEKSLVLAQGLKALKAEKERLEKESLLI